MIADNWFFKTARGFQLVLLRATPFIAAICLLKSQETWAIWCVVTWMMIRTGMLFIRKPERRTGSNMGALSNMNRAELEYIAANGGRTTMGDSGSMGDRAQKILNEWDKETR